MNLSNAQNSHPLSKDSFQIIRMAINKRFGILFGDGDRYLLENRLTARLMDLQMGDFNEYAEFIGNGQTNGQEMDTAIELLTNNETYFFREDYQLRAFLDELLPVLHAKNRRHRQLTIWSAGCSSGEEVYSIAIFIEESGLFNGWDIRVFGSDINSKMLSRARQAHFSRSAFRTTPEYLKMKYFHRRDTEWELDKGVRERCSFSKINLLDSGRTGMLGKFDVIFCRNVLMYFDRQSRVNTIDLFHRRLNTAGYLLLGHSESLFNQETPFVQVELTDAMVYQKREDAFA